MERPKCAIEDCNEGALVMFYGKLICGKCLTEIRQKELDKRWEEINAD